MAEHSYLSEGEQRARVLATGATPGPWEADVDLPDYDEPEIEACVSSKSGPMMLFCAGTDVMCYSQEDWRIAMNSQAYKDAEFIAHTDPEFILSVLGRLEEALKENDDLKKRLQQETLREISRLGQEIEEPSEVNRLWRENEKLKEEIVELRQQLGSYD